MEKKTISAGIIGAGGFIGQEHLKRLTKRIDGVAVTALYDINKEKTDALAAAYGAESMESVDALIASDKVDAIVITAWDGVHAEMTNKAIAAGKPVFCEKPLATTLEDAKKVVEAEKASGKRLLQIGFMRRFDDSYAEAKRRIDAGDIGKVVLVRSYTQDPRTTIEGTLKFAPHSGGQYLDMCVHDLDLIRWFTGAEVKRVWAIGGVFEFDLYRELNDADNCCATVQLDNGAMGFMFTNQLGSDITNVIPSAGLLVLIVFGVLEIPEVMKTLTCDMVWMVAGMSVVSTALSKTGVGELIGQTVLNILGGHPSGLFVSIVFCVACALMGTMALMSPIAASTALAGGMNVKAVVLCCCVSAWLAFVMPTGCSGTMMAFGIGNQNPMKTLKFTLPLLALTLVALIIGINIFFPIYG